MRWTALIWAACTLLALYAAFGPTGYTEEPLLPPAGAEASARPLPALRAQSQGTAAVLPVVAVLSGSRASLARLLASIDHPVAHILVLQSPEDSAVAALVGGRGLSWTLSQR